MIIINTIDMPNNCLDCCFCYDSMSCIITGDRMDFANYDTQKAATCPLMDLEDFLMKDKVETLINEISLILIEAGQSDKRFKLGEIIKYSPSEIAEILKKHKEKLQQDVPWIIDGHHMQCGKCGTIMCTKDREGDPIPQNFCPACGSKIGVPEY